MGRRLVLGIVVAWVAACGGRGVDDRDLGEAVSPLDATDVTFGDPGARPDPTADAPEPAEAGADAEPWRDLAEPRPDLAGDPEGIEAPLEVLPEAIPDPGNSEPDGEPAAEARDSELQDVVDASNADVPTPEPLDGVAEGEALVDAEPVDDAPADDGASPDPGVDAGPDPGLVNLCATKSPVPWTRTIDVAGGAVLLNEILAAPVGGGATAWVELYNPMAYPFDLSGWRLEGDLRFAFAEGTLVPARGYRVVAADAAALSGFEGVLGPLEGSWTGGDLHVELRSNADRLMDALTVEDGPPWPVTPFGSGASLAKRDPASASGLAEGWKGSALPGGTPGSANLPEPAAPAAVAGLRLNEVAGADGLDGAAAPSWVELVNAGEAPVELGGVLLLASSGATVVLAPQTLSSGELALLDLVALGLGPGPVNRLFLLSKDGAYVLDGVEVGPAPRARAVPGADAWSWPDTATPGQPNVVEVVDGVVLNEIMYHHAPVAAADGTPQASSEEWIELLNRGPLPVDVGGWQLVDDVSYTIPAGTILEPGGLMVIARNAAALAARFPGVPVTGNFKGKLDNDGASVTLQDACGNPVDRVRWADGGRWPAAADGGGSSLELQDPRADNEVPEAWGASDEAGAATWQTVSYQGVAAPSAVGPDGQWQELVVGLLDEGVVLLDDLSVVEDPDGAAVELLQNGTFDQGSAAWRLLGDHRHSQVVPDPDDPSNPVLRLTATGPTEHMHNHAETTLAGGHAIANGTTYRVSFRARWVSGSNLLNTRLYFNRLARTTRLARPEANGTPGAPNRSLQANLGPTFRDLGHSPVVPQPGATVWVSVTADDPDGVQDVTLFTSVAGAAPTATPMLGTGDGRFVAAVPGQAAATLVQFWVLASDALGATATFPAAGPDARALWKVDDGLAATNGLHNLRILLTAADADWLHAEPNVMSNDLLGATVIYDESEVYYDVSVRLKGSERGRSMPLRTGFGLHFPADRPFRGVLRSLLVDRSEGVNFGQREMIINQVMGHAGSISAEYDDLVQVIPPRLEHTGPAELQLARFGSLYLDTQFQDGSDGGQFEYELIYFPYTTDTGTPEGQKLPQPDWVVGTPIHDLGDDPEAYRYDFILKTELWRDDYAPLMAFAKALGSAPVQPGSPLEVVLDVDQWLRAFAFTTLSGAVDNYGSGAQHNAVFYQRPSDGRVLYLPHDLDFTVGVTSVGVVPNGDLARLLGLPAWRRAYYAHLVDVVATSYNAAYLGPWCERFGALLPGQDFAGHLQFVIDRAEWVMNGAPDAVTRAVPVVPFAITTNGGADLSVPAATVTLEGTAWLDVAAVWRLGDAAPLALSWTAPSTFSVALPLTCGANVVVLQGVGPRGDVVASAAITVTSQAEGCP
jgi:hypothetical protein